MADKQHHRSEPQPLSTDEYQIWAIQAREDAEIGADIHNEETFGDDSHRGGWTFEENLAATEQLSHHIQYRVHACT